METRKARKHEVAPYVAIDRGVPAADLSGALMSRKAKHQALVAVSQYLTDEIERGVSFYETQAQKIDGRYLAQVEKLATRTKAKDPYWRSFSATRYNRALLHRR